jgi:hypothetical protein
MLSRHPRPFRSAIVAAVALLGTAACAGNGPAPGAGVRADLSVVIQDPRGSSSSYTIRCAGSGEAEVEGTAGIDARDACRALGRPAVQNRLIRGPSAERVCTQVYGGPQTAMLSGTLEGQSVNAVVTRDDGCGIGDWDNLLKDLLLPVSRGAR